MKQTSAVFEDMIKLPVKFTGTVERPRSDETSTLV